MDPKIFAGHIAHHRNQIATISRRTIECMDFAVRGGSSIQQIRQEVNQILRDHEILCKNADEYFSRVTAE